jgi:AcrR family transcriptional regulator
MTTDFLAGDKGWPFSRAKTAVLTATVAVIREEGPRSATLKRITKRIGITEPAVFRHFDGVDGLFEGLFFTVERVHELLLATLVPGLPPMKRLRSILLFRSRLLTIDPDLGYLVIHAGQVFGEYPELNKRLADLVESERSILSDCCEEGLSKGVLRSDLAPTMLADLVAGGFESMVGRWFAAGGSFDLEKECEAMLDAFERLVSAPSHRKAPKKSA